MIGEIRAQAADDRDAAVRSGVEYALRLAGERLTATTDRAQADLAGKKDVIDARLDQVGADLRHDLAAPAISSSHCAPRRPRASAPSTAQPLDSRQDHPRAGRRHRVIAGGRSRARRPAASGASAWPRTCCGSPASSKASTTASRRAVDGRRRPRLHVPAAQGPRAAHGREVPARQLPALPRGGHRRSSAHAHRDQFLRDVRDRGARSSPTRGYLDADDGTVDCVLLFIPNEQRLRVHPGARPRAARRRAARTRSCCARRSRSSRCSPSCARRSTASGSSGPSDEILRAARRVSGAVGRFARARWTSWRALDSARRFYDELNGTRRRQLERPLDRIEELRRSKGLTADPNLRADAADVRASKAATPE